MSRSKRAQVGKETVEISERGWYESSAGNRIKVGMRHGKPVVLTVQAGQMHIDGHEFFVTGNRVWLTDHVPPSYLAVARE